MTQEQKEKLTTDICARFPYGVYVKMNDTDMRVIDIYYSRGDVFFNLVGEKTVVGVEVDRLRPYLRSLSTMTEDEKKEFTDTFDVHEGILGNKIELLSSASYTWLIKNRFDYQGLIPLGLAFEAYDWMYRDGQ